VFEGELRSGMILFCPAGFAKRLAVNSFWRRIEGKLRLSLEF
jgi:hypothetical protein